MLRFRRLFDLSIARSLMINGGTVKLKALAVAAMLGLGTLPLALQAAELPAGPHVVTSGTASVDATPDIATLAIEVSVSANDSASAKKQADERVAEYFAFLQ